MTAQLDLWIQALVEFMRTNQQWALPIVFFVAFAECVAIFSWLVPATLFFTAFGAVAGASFGFWLSYWVGLRLGPRVDDYWPLRDNPNLLRKGHDFFEKWGFLGIIIGHFVGPVRAVIALVAGIVQMPFWLFQLANFVASFAWGFGLLYGAGRATEMMMQFTGK